MSSFVCREASGGGVRGAPLDVPVRLATPPAKIRKCSSACDEYYAAIAAAISELTDLDVLFTANEESEEYLAIAKSYYTFSTSTESDLSPTAGSPSGSLSKAFHQALPTGEQSQY